MKQCYACKKIKSLDKFHIDKTRPLGVTKNCKKCLMGSIAVYNKDGSPKPESKKKVNAEKLRNMYFYKYWPNLKHTERITKYGELLSKYNYCCAICKKAETAIDKNSNIRRLSIDHNHVTGEVRGLLCSACNTSIGLMKENIPNLFNAIYYLKEFEK